MKAKGKGMFGGMGDKGAFGGKGPGAFGGEGAALALGAAKKQEEEWSGGKQKDKCDIGWKKGDWYPWGGHLLWPAIEECVSTFMHLETEWDEDKLKKKLKDFFHKGARQVDYKNPSLPETLKMYADAALGLIFS